jgi:hypothetical protein
MTAEVTAKPWPTFRQLAIRCTSCRGPFVIHVAIVAASLASRCLAQTDTGEVSPIDESLKAARVRFWEGIERKSAARTEILARGDSFFAYKESLRDKFIRYLDENPDVNVDGEIKWYVSHFGAASNETDLAWILSAYDLVLPTNPGFRPYGTQADGAGFESERRRLIQLQFARELTHRFVDQTDKECLPKYYRWVGCFTPLLKQRGVNYFAAYGEKIRESFRADNPDYWWEARNVCLMMYATGREDLVKGAEPDAIPQKFDQFVKWFSENGPYLRPSPIEPQWKLDENLKAAKYGYVPFFSGSVLPPLTYDVEAAPFPGLRILPEGNAQRDSSTAP